MTKATLQSLKNTDLAVVVQGPLLGTSAAPRAFTARCLNSIRKVLPGAEIIFSTWEDADTDGLDFDRLVRNRDPGAVRFIAGDIDAPNNVNRQIASTLGGLRAIDRPFTLKLRSDSLLQHDGFRHYWGLFPLRATTWRVFDERIIICDHFTRHPDRGEAWLFHPSDWFQFGRTSDLLRLWDIPRVEDATSLFNEQWIWRACLLKYGPLDFSRFDDAGEDLRFQDELALANNFVVLSREQFGAQAQKYNFSLVQWLLLYTHADWRKIYAQHCAPGFPANPDLLTRLKNACASLGRHWPIGLRALSHLFRRFPNLGDRL